VLQICKGLCLVVVAFRLLCEYMGSRCSRRWKRCQARAGRLPTFFRPGWKNANVITTRTLYIILLGCRKQGLLVARKTIHYS
jgi:hypothetical protein